MTVQEYIEKELSDRGLWPEKNVQAVMEIVKKETEDTSLRWSDDKEGYPSQLLAVLVLSAKAATLKWIDANMPGAFYRPMFE